jgi:hypothetical protein
LGDRLRLKKERRKPLTKNIPSKNKMVKGQTPLFYPKLISSKRALVKSNGE